MTDSLSQYVEVTAKLRRKRTLKVAYNKSPSDDTKIPAIRFSGDYLEGLGFIVGGKYDLTINEDKSITLTPHSPESESDDEST